MKFPFLHVGFSLSFYPKKQQEIVSNLIIVSLHGVSLSLNHYFFERSVLFVLSLTYS